MSYSLNIKKLEFFRDEFKDCFFITNIKYNWKFILDNKPHSITLLYKKIFGKRIIYLDNKEIYNSRKYTYNFNLSFPIEFYNITIAQKNNFYTLRINNISFNNILNDLKLQKFNILEDTYKENQRQKKIRKLNKRKNKILEETINNLNKNEKIRKIMEKRMKNGLETIKEEVINTSNKLKDESYNEDNSKTIRESFEMHDKAFAILDDIHNINNINNDNDKNKFQDKEENKKKSFNQKKKSIKSLKKFQKKDKFKPSEKFQYNTFENNNTSLNEMIGIDILDETHNSEERNNENIFRHNIFSSNSRSFFDKGSMTTQSN